MELPSKDYHKTLSIRLPSPLWKPLKWVTLSDRFAYKLLIHLLGKRLQGAYAPTFKDFTTYWSTY